MRRRSGPCWRALCAALASAAWAAVWATGSLSHAQSAAEPSLELRLEWAVDMVDGRTSKLELVATPALELELGAQTRMVAILRARMDALDGLAPGRGRLQDYSPLSRPLRGGAVSELELRELYLDFRIAGADVRAGKQQIVWGKADGLKVLDVVDPQDFREFVLDDLDDSRIPLWSLNVERRLGPVNLQLLWTPDPTVHELPAPGAQFAFTSPLIVPARPPPGLPVVLRSDRHPRRLLSDSDAGLRLSGSWDGWDLALHYLSHHDDAPVARRTLPRRLGEPIAVDIGYDRNQLVGGSFSKALGDWVFRGELGVSLDRRLPTARLADRDGVVKTTDTSYVLGIDWYGLSSTLLSTQLFQSVVGARHEELARDHTESTLSVLARRQFANDTWLLELTGLRSVNRRDGLLRLRLSHALRDDLTVWLGADTFYGSAEGQFGQFRKEDRLVFGTEIHF